MSHPGSPGGWAVELHGFGHVGRAVWDLLPRHGFGNGGVWARSGLLVPKESHRSRVFVDATSPRYDGEEATTWLDHLEGVLEAGVPVVTCNKAPLAIGWDRLRAAAEKGATTLSCSATVGGGTPVLLAIQRLHRSQGVVRVDASLNGTLAYACDRIAAGTSLAGAIAEAVRAGLTEPDPTLDVDGTDSLAKAVIVHNLLYPEQRALSLDPERPRLRLDEREIRGIAAGGEPARAVATVIPGAIGLSLAPFAEASSRAGGPAPAAVRVTLRDGTESALVGPGAGAAVTAGAVLGDLLDLAEGPSRWGGGIVA